MFKISSKYLFLAFASICFCFSIVDSNANTTTSESSTGCYICDYYRTCDDATSGQTGGSSCEDGCILLGKCEPNDDPEMK